MAEKSISKHRRQAVEHTTNEKILVGWEEISAHFGDKYNVHTLKRWMRHQSMPVARLPNGKPATDPELIRRWLWLRWQQRWGIKNLRDATGKQDEN